MKIENVSVVKIPLFIFAVNVISLVLSQRKIEGGQIVKIEEAKGYMVYLLKATASEKKYDAWMCGGALVSEKFIVTSAACVEDVRYMYAIAGYITYVPASKLAEDECTRQVKRKIIRYCVPKAYTFTYEQIQTWANIDIAVAEVDRKYEFNNQKEPGCSHPISPIKVNYHKNIQKTGTSCVVMGWGHTKVWREPKDTQDYNEKTVRYAPTSIIDKTRCIETFSRLNLQMKDVVEKYMLCADGSGLLNPKGEILQPGSIVGGDKIPEPGAIDGCDSLDLTKRRMSYYECIIKKFLRTGNWSVSEQQTLRERRNGICQNDHGGPLVTWAGSQEFLIGVASVFNLAKNGECRGPYLYTSTYCNSGFLRCMLKGEKVNYRTHGVTIPDDDIDTMVFLRGDIEEYCNKPAKERGFEIIDEKVNWDNITERGSNTSTKGKTKTKTPAKVQSSTASTASTTSTHNPILRVEVPFYPQMTLYPPTTPVYIPIIYTTPRTHYMTRVFGLATIFRTRHPYD